MRQPTWIVISIFSLLTAAFPLSAQDEFDNERRALWSAVDLQISRLRDEIGFKHLSPKVRRALEQVPRHLFIPENQRSHAYENRPLPIGYGQSISQPLMVALMSELLDVCEDENVFELGTGSGYQAAVLDTLGAHVFSMEIIPELAAQARQTLDTLGYSDVETRVGDGYFGWPEAAPFDAIIVTAASDHVPPPLLSQLKPGGRMLIPVGGDSTTQKLVMITRDGYGNLTTQELLPVDFSPMTGAH